MTESLLDQVIEQIVRDVAVGDYTAIAELIAVISDDEAQHFLPEATND